MIDRMTKVKPRELLHAYWLELKFREEDEEWKHSPHVLELIVHHNKVSWWVRDMIMTTDDTSIQAKTLSLFINVAKYCHEIKCFEVLFSVVGGLLLDPLKGNRNLWKELNATDTAVWKVLRDLVAPKKNFSNYRDSLLAKNCRVPFIGCVLGDLGRCLFPFISY